MRALAFEDEDHLLVGNDGGRLTRWTLTGEPRHEDLVEKGSLIAAVTPLGGGRLALARGDAVDLVSGDAGPRQISTVTKGVGNPTALAVSDDGRTMAAGFTDGAVRVWSLEHLAQDPITLRPHPSWIRALTFDKAGETLISVGDDGTIQSSVVGGSRLAEIACDVTWRDLTDDEIQAYFGDAPAVRPTCPGLPGVGQP